MILPTITWHWSLVQNEVLEVHVPGCACSIAGSERGHAHPFRAVYREINSVYQNSFTF